MRFSVIATGLCLGLTSLEAPAQQEYLGEDVITPAVPRREAHFGKACDLRGDWAIVGAPGAWFHRRGEGRAQVFRFDGRHWRLEQQLLPDVPPPGGHLGSGFGGAVAIDEPHALVGEKAGVYFFEKIGPRWEKVWSRQGSNFFGQTLDLRGETAAVANATDWCLVYRARPWRHVQTLIGPKDSKFGESLDLAGEHLLLVGAPFDDGAVDGTGAAYVYRWNGFEFVLEQKLEPSDGASGDQFGQAVSVEGDVAIVGAMMHDGPPGQDSGAAYVYRFDGSRWNEEKKVTPRNWWCGTDVATNGERIFVATGSYGSYEVDSWIHDKGRWRKDQLLPGVRVSSNYPVDKYLEVDGGTLILGESSRNVDSVLDSGQASILSFVELGVEPEVLPLGEHPTLRIRGADRGRSFVIAVTAIDGVPVLEPIAWGRFDGSREGRFERIALPPLVPATLKITGFTRRADGSWIESDTETLVVQ